ncbi:hypothetical protein CPT_Premi_021 [Proteus phage Premi]|uniref:Uncharacterized protein n=1 Tax=Proteus phage Premi TaxID=3097470 RepID=A0ABZ0ZZD0_9CAUD|nr:hypothetical protein CPT_Premi_021 [Proteus phage Premi]
MKVESITIHYQPHQTSLDGKEHLYFVEGQEHDLHYIFREGQHIVNFVGAGCNGTRTGISIPAEDVRQVTTILKV